MYLQACSLKNQGKDVRTCVSGKIGVWTNESATDAHEHSTSAASTWLRVAQNSISAARVGSM